MMSPLSLAIVFEQIKKGQSMDLKEVFEMEHKMAQAYMEHTEFFEGVRALLVDKDKSTIKSIPKDFQKLFF